MKITLSLRLALILAVGAALALGYAVLAGEPVTEQGAAAASAAAPLTAVAGLDRVVMLGGKTYLNGQAGYGGGPRRGARGGARRGQPGGAASAAPTGPAPTVVWSKLSGPGTVTFADATAPVTTATFSAVGDYVLALTATAGEATAMSTLGVKVQTPPAAAPLAPVDTKRYTIDNPLWNGRVKALIVHWIPHCIDEINDPNLRQGGMNNIIEAAKKLAGEPAGRHLGYPFSNAWVFNTMESMCVALMVDPRGDQEIVDAQAKIKATLEDWIPKILAAQEPDGYFQTRFTLDTRGAQHWDPRTRGEHEGYVAGYLLEAAIAHYLMTDKKDARLYDAAKRLADCWENAIGPAPKKAWYDGHQEMEIALVRFGHFVNDVEGPGKGQKYIDLAKFLLDGRQGGSEYDQSHLPVVQQYEAVGHAVRASYTYAGMAAVAMETRDTDYQSATMALWDNLVNRKYYVTGGVGSGETSEGFGPDYSLRNNAYCESCSSCGMVFFQHQLNLAYHDAKFADLLEETLYNALLGSIDLQGENFCYTNPLSGGGPRTPWHQCPCCVGNIPRVLLSLPTWMYAKGPEGLYVNLFLGSTVTVEDVAGTDVRLVQVTDYPWSGNVSITVNPAAPKQFAVRIRVPDRSVSEIYSSTPEVQGLTMLAVNGEAVAPTIENGYAVINRQWTAGDKIELVLPMKVQRVTAIDRVAANRGRVALRYGPLLYNVEQADQQDVNQVLSPDVTLSTEWNGDLLGGVTVIKGAWADGSPLTAVPNYVRNNRLMTNAAAPGGAGAGARRGGRGGGVGDSIVWLRAQ